MRIAFFLSTFPVISETFILRQITGLLDLGHEVDIYSQRTPEGGGPVHPEVSRYSLIERTTYLDKLMPAESGYWSMPVWPISGQTWIPGAERPIENSDRILQAVATIQKCLSAVPALTIQMLDPEQYGHRAVSLEALYNLGSLLNRTRVYDVVHAHFGPTAHDFRFTRALWGVPYVVSFHGYDCSQHTYIRGRNVYSSLFETADLVTANSHYMSQGLQKLGCPTTKLRILHYGLEIDVFPFQVRRVSNGEPVRVLTVARFVEKKGLEFSLRAVAKLTESHPNLRYDIIGDGPLRPGLEGLIKHLGLGDRATLHGAQHSDYVRTMMARAHLFLLASVTAVDGDQEGTPVSLIEAQACGMPVISTKHSGIPEVVVHGRSGLLVPERDVEALADSLLHLIEHPEVWPEMGREGRRVVEEQFNMSARNRDLVSLYEEAIAEYDGSRKSP